MKRDAFILHGYFFYRRQIDSGRLLWVGGHVRLCALCMHIRHIVRVTWTNEVRRIPDWSQTHIRQHEHATNRALRLSLIDLQSTAAKHRPFLSRTLLLCVCALVGERRTDAICSGCAARSVCLSDRFLAFFYIGLYNPHFCNLLFSSFRRHYWFAFLAFKFGNCAPRYCQSQKNVNIYVHHFGT